MEKEESSHVERTVLKQKYKNNYGILLFEEYPNSLLIKISYQSKGSYKTYNNNNKNNNNINFLINRRNS